MKKLLTVLCLASLMLTAAPARSHQASCGAAFAYGDKKFNETPGDNDPSQRGWQIAVDSGSSLSRPIYADEGWDGVSNGTRVGDLEVTYEDGQLKIDFKMLEGYAMSGTSLYAGDKSAPNTAHGHYEKYHHEELADAIKDSYEIDVSVYKGDTLYIGAAQVEVCAGKTDDDDCDKDGRGRHHRHKKDDWDDIVWMGAWQNSVEYADGNVVQYGGSSYINTCCKAAGTEPPLDFVPDGCWDLMAAKGDTGAQGETGPQGTDGAAGPMGPQGSAGPKGDTGPQGVPGVKGDTGAKGDQGIQGIQGEVGPKGDQGVPGVKGDTGDTGPQGAAGADGAAGPMGPQGSAGPKGDTGPQGVPGVKGDTGAKGDQGIQGLIGPAGPQGPVGPQGLQGLKGEKGDDGDPGDAGPEGPKGDKGDTGPQGPQGPAGECICTTSLQASLAADSCYDGEVMTGIDTAGRIICSSGGSSSVENAFALGQTELNDIFSSSRWGWQLTVNKGQTLTQPIYAGARQNDLAQGKKAGTLTVSYTGSKVHVKFKMNAGFTMSETHLYAGKGNVPTTEPRQYGHRHEGLKKAAVDTYQLKVGGEEASLNVVAHAAVFAEK